MYRSEQAPACPHRTAAARHCPAPAAHPRLWHLQGAWRHSGPLPHAGNLGINTYIVCMVLGDGGDGGKAQLCRAHAVPALSSLRSLPPSQFPAHPLPFCSFLGGILLNDGYCKFTSGCEFPIIAKQRVPASTRGTWMTPGHQHRAQIQAAQLSPARLGGISRSGAKEIPSLDRAVLLGRGQGKAGGLK